MPRSQKLRPSRRLGPRQSIPYEPYRSDRQRVPYDRREVTDFINAKFDCNVQSWTLCVVDENGETRILSSGQDENTAADTYPIDNSRYGQAALMQQLEPDEVFPLHRENSAQGDYKPINEDQSKSWAIANSTGRQDDRGAVATSFTPSPLLMPPLAQLGRSIRKKESTISDREAVTTYLLERFTEMQQLFNKSIAKIWIRGICPRKQAKFPYMNRKRAESAAGAPEVPQWWPKITVCSFTEPDHVKKEERKALLLHLLRLRPSPQELLAWNKDKTARPNPVHEKEGWTAFLRSLTPPATIDRINDIAGDKAKRISRLLEDLYTVAAMEEQYELHGIGGDNPLPNFVNPPKIKSRRRRREPTSTISDSDVAMRHNSIQSYDSGFEQSNDDSTASLDLAGHETSVGFNNAFADHMSVPTTGTLSYASGGTFYSRGTTISPFESPPEAQTFSSPSYISTAATEVNQPSPQALGVKSHELPIPGTGNPSHYGDEHFRKPQVVSATFDSNCWQTGAYTEAATASFPAVIHHQNYLQPVGDPAQNTTTDQWVAPGDWALSQPVALDERASYDGEQLFSPTVGMPYHSSFD